MAAILGLGFVDLALGILVMVPLSVGLRKQEPISTAFYLLFQTCMAVGMALVAMAGLMAFLN